MSERAGWAARFAHRWTPETSVPDTNRPGVVFPFVLGCTLRMTDRSPIAYFRRTAAVLLLLAALVGGGVTPDASAQSTHAVRGLEPVPVAAPTEANLRSGPFRISVPGSHGNAPAPPARVARSTGNAQSQSTAPASASLSLRDRFRIIQHDIVSVGFAFKTAGSAAGAHWSDEPPSWPDGALGYAARVGSSAAGSVVQDVLVQGVAEAVDVRTGFQPRRTGSFSDRLRHVVVGTVTARTSGEARVPSVPLVVGTYGSTLAQQRWETGQTRFGRAAAGSVISLGVDLFLNAITEFAPRP
jgi:hypothetical protein